MKIVDRKTFLQMPKGTVFCEFPILDSPNYNHADTYPLAVFAPHILEDSSESDFSSTCLGYMSPVAAQNSMEEQEILIDLQGNLGKEYAFASETTRDGLYENDSVGFAIYSRNEVQEMIDLLQEALTDGYNE